MGRKQAIEILKDPATLKTLREENGKSRAEVAAALRVTKNAITNYECGIRSINISQVLILADLYDCSEKEIIEAQLNSYRFDQLSNQRKHQISRKAV